MATHAESVTKSPLASLAGLAVITQVASIDERPTVTPAQVRPLITRPITVMAMRSGEKDGNLKRVRSYAKQHCTPEAY